MRFKDGAGTAWDARFSFPLTLNSIAEILEDFKMVNCTKSKDENEVYLCILPGARAIENVFLFVKRELSIIYRELIINFNL